MLFDIHKPRTDTNPLFESNHPAEFISSQDDYLSKYLKGVDWTAKGKMYHFTSNGRFALHDLIIYLAKQLKGVDCTVTSFNLSKKAANAFVRAWDNRMFTGLRFILNAQKKSNFADAVRILEGKFQMAFTAIHAKAALITNGEQYITIVTTGNLSSNNNIERGFISTDKKIYDFDYNWTNNIFNS